MENKFQPTILKERRVVFLFFVESMTKSLSYEDMIKNYFANNIGIKKYYRWLSGNKLIKICCFSGYFRVYVTCQFFKCVICCDFFLILCKYFSHLFLHSWFCIVFHKESSQNCINFVWRKMESTSICEYLNLKENINIYVCMYILYIYLHSSFGK